MSTVQDCRRQGDHERERGEYEGGASESRMAHHALIDSLASSGNAILLISSELPEVLNLSTRILVLRGGRIAGELTRAQASQEKLMRLMANVA